MEIRDLRSFAAVARLGSFTHAADELGYTQSAVSQHVANLEDALTHQLFSRRPLVLTPRGKRLLEHVTQVLLRLDIAEAELRRAPKLPSVRVAMSALANLCHIHEETNDLTVLDAEVAIAIQLLASGDVEIAAIGGVAAPNTPLRPTETGLLSILNVHEEPLVVVVARSHPLRASSLSLEAFTDSLWISAPNIIRFESMNRLSSTTYEGNDTATLIDLVGSQRGIALLPKRVVPTREDIRSIAINPDETVFRTELFSLGSTD